MCLITFALQQHPEFPLIVAANRDEFFSRPTRAAQFWAGDTHTEAPQPFMAGRDLQAGGTWLGLNRSGRFAALTNYREVTKGAPPSQPSRGALPVNALCTEESSCDHLHTLASSSDRYSGFNLISGTAKALYYYSNRRNAPPEPLSAGYYSLSNGLLDSPWPKVNNSRASLQELVEQDIKLGDSAGAQALVKQLQRMMRNKQLASQQNLPNTGVPTALEHQLSSLFIEHPGLPDYGTRATTVVLVDRYQKAHFFEFSFDRAGQLESEVCESWEIQEQSF